MQRPSKFKGSIFGNFLCVFFFIAAKLLSTTLPISWSQHISCIDLLREKEEHEVSLVVFADTHESENCTRCNLKRHSVPSRQLQGHRPSSKKTYL